MYGFVVFHLTFVLLLAALQLCVNIGAPSSLLLVAFGKRLAGHGDFFLVLQATGELYGTGFNAYGGLGLGSASGGDGTPRQMLNASRVTDVSAGVSHACFRTEPHGQASCVGYDNYGELGRGDIAGNKYLPAPVLGLDAGVAQVFLGAHSSFAVMESTGHVYAWGHNNRGGLGIGIIESIAQRTPVLVGEGTPLSALNVTQAASGLYHVCYLSDTGRAFCAGDSDLGQTGTGSTTDGIISTPVEVDTAAFQPDFKFVALASGEYHVCACSESSDLYCWGWNGHYQSGGADSVTPQYSPTLAAGVVAGTAKFVWAGTLNTFVIDTTTGRAVAFGRDKYGEFGNGESSGSSSATPVEFGNGVTGIVELRGGLRVTCILNAVEDVWCAGKNEFGQFGVGNTDPSYTLVQMMFPTLAPTRSPTPSTWTAAPTSNRPTRLPTKTPIVGAADDNDSETTATAMAAGTSVCIIVVAAAVVGLAL